MISERVAAAAQAANSTDAPHLHIEDGLPPSPTPTHTFIPVEEETIPTNIPTPTGKPTAMEAELTVSLGDTTSDNIMQEAADVMTVSTHVHGRHQGVKEPPVKRAMIVTAEQVVR